jgi:hypothetical protein
MVPSRKSRPEEEEIGRIWKNVKNEMAEVCRTQGRGKKK